ncbi:MAG: hypothetical protein QOG06_2212, partial [Gaiellaceae bacterium]|nr:hypothetical protein [Gaiellaceae bacterium]
MSARLPEYPSPALRDCPYPFFEQARTEAPVYKSPHRDEYLVFGHEEIEYVLRHHELYSEELPEGTLMDCGAETMISAVPPPKHTAMRRLASRPFTPGRLRAVEPQVRRIVDELIDGFLDRGEVELMHDFALLLPAILTCELMDLPTEGPEWELILGQWAGTIDGADNMNEEYWPGLVEYFEGKVRERLEQPGDDIISELIRLQVDEDGAPNVPYLTVIATELMVGGAGTTGLMIVNAMWLLLEHPDQLELVRSDFSLIPAMLEESLRVESVILDRERIEAVDTVLGGVAFPAGARLRLVLGSGNRDERVFADADRFDVTRRHTELKQHFGFGYGIHFCLGAPLARLEGQVAFEQLFTRLDNLRF